MLKLGDYMQKKPKTKKKDEVTKKAKVSTSSLPDPSLSAESRLAAVEKLCDRYQTENQVRHTTVTLYCLIQNLICKGLHFHLA